MGFKVLVVVLLGLTLAQSTCDFSADVYGSYGITCPAQSNDLQIGDETYGGSDIDVLSFGDFTLTHGDVQKRVATRNNFYGSGGISVGDLIVDNKQYALIVGGNLNWQGQGEVYPLSQRIFVGGSATSYPSNLAQRFASNCSQSGCLNPSFDALYNYWNQFSSFLASQSDNVQTTFLNGVITLSCPSSSGVQILTLAPSVFNRVSGYSISSNCPSDATWIFNIEGDGEVIFGGNSIVASGYVIWNIEGSNRVTIASSVNGNIVAPNSNLQMNQGTIYGQIVAGNISNIVQVNQPSNCSSNSGSATASATGSASGYTCVSGSASSASGSASASASTGSASASTGSASASASSSGNSGSASASASSSTSNTGSASTTGSTTGSAFTTAALTTGSLSTTEALTTGSLGNSIGTNPTNATNNISGAATYTISAVIVLVTLII